MKAPGQTRWRRWRRPPEAAVAAAPALTLAAARRASVPARPSQPVQWNLWQLESLRNLVQDPDRRLELRYLLMTLRDHAAIDGTLPLEFDPLVRESFGDLLGMA